MSGPSRHAARAMLASVAIAASMFLMPGVVGAAPPAGETLNPPPPPIYTCMPVGAGTICDEVQVVVREAEPTDVWCPDFQIYDQGIENQHGTRYYDTAGNLTRRVVRERWTDARWSNPLTGKFVPYTQSSIGTDVLAIPGDFDTSTRTDRGENLYRTATGGEPILVSAGRVVVGPGGELLEVSGPQWAVDLFFRGDQSVLDEVCAALR